MKIAANDEVRKMGCCCGNSKHGEKEEKDCCKETEGKEEGGEKSEKHSCCD